MQAVWRGHSVRRRAELQGRREAAAALQAKRQDAAVRIQVSPHTKRLQYTQNAIPFFVCGYTYILENVYQLGSGPS